MTRTPSRPVAVAATTALLAAVALAATVLVPHLRPVATAQVAARADPRVEQLLARMSLDDKVGQMTQVDRGALKSTADLATYRIGSLLSGGGSAPTPNTAQSWADMYDNFQRTALSTPLGIPLVYGVDAVHGHNNVRGATIFPHNIGLGATRDPALVERIGAVTAKEVAGTGIDWNFAPCLCVARDDRWGRTYESFGEVPEIPTAMTTYIDGLQGATLGGTPESVLATAKHYIGDGGTEGGDDQGDARIGEQELRSVHLPPFKAAVDRGVGSVMISYSSWNGVKAHGHRYLITDLLKTELGFTGFVVSDWAGIDQLDGATGFTGAEVAAAVNAGIDMVMVPTDYQRFTGLLKAEVQAGRVSTARIDDANRRILTKKFELGLFERPLTDRSLTSTVGSAAHRDLARQAVRQSQVLLRNDGVLPLAKSGRYFVAGKSADDIGNQSGGWTISWQGGSGNTTPGTTILQGIRDLVGSGATVTHDRYGAGVDGSYTAAIAVVGETPYAEGQGDRPYGLGLDREDLETINRLRSTGVPVVVVLVSGRPLDVANQVGDWDALLASWLPGTEGRGVADVLFGDYNPTGKLPVTWMGSGSQQPINAGDGKAALYPLGHGLSYRPTTTSTTPTSTSTTTSTTTTTTTTTTSAPPPGGCVATARVTSSWQGGFQAEVTVANPGTTRLNGWTVTWTRAGGQTVDSLWNGRLTQTGTAVSVDDVGWNGTLAPGASGSFGYTASGSAATPELTCRAR
ncbi:glycoside hydrolase family 3 C-terminal domain-containing protein [Saccharothrix sp. 6-C]|nr:glycoside hydrolase family 3 C-terminal domain-containing protein [Saccharothrix sp. 6-C]